MKKALELKDITFSYDGSEKPVLHSLCLSIAYGEFCVLSGISGEGKTTVLSLINGIIPFLTPGKLSGEIWIDGEKRNDEKVCKRAETIGSVLQNADEQIVHEKVSDEVAFGCENRNMPADEIAQAIQRSLAMMKLKPEFSTRTLSGGQKQRLITAATLAMGQKILILDEPLANLDREGSLLLLETLKTLTKEGYAVLLVEHRLDVVLPFADRVFRLSEGKIIEEASPEQWYRENREKIKPQTEKKPFGEVCISAENIHFSAGGREIIRGLSVDIHRGEKIVLLGENGCGKTTLMRLLAKITKPDDGEIRQTLLPKMKRKKANSAWFQKAGFVYQNPSYQLFMPTLREEIEYAAFSQEYAAEIAERFGLTSLLDRHPHSLSEGQKRRAGIAAVCAVKPEVIFLDEPTVGQDHENLKKIVHALNRIQEETGCALITVTHDIRCAAALADRTLIMDQGTILSEGGPALADEYFTRNIRV